MEDEKTPSSPEIKPESADKKPAPNSWNELLEFVEPPPARYHQFQGASKYIKDIEMGFNISEKKEFVVRFKCISDVYREFFVFFADNCHGLVIIVLTETNDTITSPVDPNFIAFVNNKVKEDKDLENRIIIQYIVITPNDYSRASKTSVYIYNLITIKKNMSSAVSFTKSLLADETFLVNQDLDKVYNFISRNSPHEIMARGDVGFIVYRLNKDAQQRPEPFIAVLGFTQFIEHTQYNLAGLNIKKIVPVIRISEIVVDPPVGLFLAMVLTIAVKVFIQSNGWRKPFRTSDHKNNFNIGKLVLDSQGRPLSCTNVQEQNQLIKQYFERPFLALDTIEGHYSLSGLQAIAYDHTAVRQDMATSLDIPQLTQIPLIVGGWEEYTGIIKINDKLVDSRVVDYLSLIDQGVEAISAADFLTPPTNPNARIDEIHKYHKEFFPTGRAMVNILNGPAVEQMVNALEKIDIRYENENNRSTFDISALLTSGGNRFDRGIVDEWVMPNNGMNPYA